MCSLNVDNLGDFTYDQYDRVYPEQQVSFANDDFDVYVNNPHFPLHANYSSSACGSYVPNRNSIRRNIVGRSYRNAVIYLQRHRIRFRIIAVDGVVLPVTQDYQPNRVNLTVRTRRNFPSNTRRNVIEYVNNHRRSTIVTRVTFG